jgi:hypothetical protein
LHMYYKGSDGAWKHDASESWPVNGAISADAEWQPGRTAILFVGPDGRLRRLQETIA